MIERLLWVLVTGLSISAAICLSWISWLSLRETPTITLADSATYHIWNYPFPAVTVCNFNTISKKQAYKLAHTLKKPTNTSTEQLAWDLRYLYHLIDPNIGNIQQTTLTSLQKILDDNNITIDNIIQYLAPNCKEMMEKCTWKGQQFQCSEQFEQIKTTEGYCCSFNYFALKNSTFVGPNAMPRRVAASGYQTALEVVINAKPEDYFASPFSSLGHRVIIHYPYNFPGGNSLTMVQSIQAMTFIGVRPSLFKIDVRGNVLSVNERNCVFDYERELSYFKYTYYNCINECRANLTLKLCGCIPFYYNYNNNKSAKKNESSNKYSKVTKVCNLKDIPCLFKNRRKIWSSFLGHLNTSGLSSVSEQSDCLCLPDCYYCYYAIEASSGSLEKEYAANKLIFLGVKLSNQSIFRVFYDDIISERYTKSVGYYWHLIYGFFGGVVALFTGFSIVSIIEVIYFFTIRPVLDFLVRTRSKQMRSNKNKKTHNSQEVENSNAKIYYR